MPFVTKGDFCVATIIATVSTFLYLFYRAYDMGEFYIVRELNLKLCDSIPIPQNHACKHIQSLSDKSMIMSCGHLHDVFKTLSPQYIPFYNYQTIKQRISNFPSIKRRGTIYRVTDDDYYETPIPMKLKKYIFTDFHPSGMSTVKYGRQEFVYVINYTRDGPYISVFKVDTKNNELIYWTSIEFDSDIILDNIAVIPHSNGNFYHTVHKNEPGSWSSFLDSLFGAKASKVQYCETADDFFMTQPSQNVKANCTVVLDGMNLNGITLTNSYDELYVVSTKHVLGYDIDKADASKLSLSSDINTIYPCDGITTTPNVNNQLLVGCFPYPFSLFYQVQTYPNLNISGMIRAIDLNVKNSSALRIDVNGTVISGMSAALKIGDNTVGISYFDNTKYITCSDQAIFQPVYT
eukprot:247485_1